MVLLVWDRVPLYFKFFKDLFLFYVFKYAYMYVHYVSAVPAEARRGHQILWHWSYK